MDAPEEKRKRSTWFWVLVAAAAVGCAGLAAALLFVIATPMIAKAIERAEQDGCAAEMRGVYQDLIFSKARFPPEGGSGLQVWWIEGKKAGGSPESYAWRDMEAFPLERFPGTDREPLAACNGEPRHAAGVAHVLYTDGSIETLSLDALRVGPDSPIPELRTLTRD